MIVNRFVNHASLLLTRELNQERDFPENWIGRPILDWYIRIPSPAMVAGEDEEGIVKFSRRFELLDDSTNDAIQIEQLPVVVLRGSIETKDSIARVRSMIRAIRIEYERPVRQGPMEKRQGTGGTCPDQSKRFIEQPGVHVKDSAPLQPAFQ